MYVTKILFFMILMIAYVSLLKPIINSETYGPYRVSWDRLNLCHGPKRVDVTKQTGRLFRNVDTSFTFFLNTTVLERATIEEVKITVAAEYGNNSKAALWTYKTKDPCKHYAIWEIFKNAVKMKSCVLEKGTYHHVLNFTYMTRTFLGSSFFYGKFLFKSTILSKKGNILCLNVRSIFEKAGL